MKILTLILLCAGLSPFAAALRPKTPPPVYVTLWFDTEDYVLPASDDAAKKLAEILTKLGVRGTFKVVGEKARTLERRGRGDVIEAIRRHEIGYHSDWHSRHPTPAEYLRDADYREGVQEFLLREGQGLADVERIFGMKAFCYGQPGSSWGPQAYRALRSRGVPMYLDEAEHVGIDDQPFYYGGMLNVFRMRSNATRMDLSGGGSLAEGKARFRRVLERLRANGGGLISIYYHPCEFVHREFWDAVNFARGNNPPREQWKLPATRTAAETAQAYSDFEKYVEFMRDEENVKFVTCEEMLGLYPDPVRGHAFRREELLDLARGLEGGISFVRSGQMTLSAADVFVLLTGAVDSWSRTRAFPETIACPVVDGPERPFNAAGPAVTEVGWDEFIDATQVVAAFCRSQQMIPSDIRVGSHSLSPADYLATLGAVFGRIGAGGEKPRSIAVARGRIAFEKYVAEDSTKIWGWVIFPEGFHAPRIMELARLQAWTLKPAALRDGHSAGR